jgi:hypothetical protein
VKHWLRDLARRKTAAADFEASIESELPAPGPNVRFAHCDQMILHAPGECVYCDCYPDWQRLRQEWGIAFTGHEVGIDGAVVPCPADVSRPDGAHQMWGGNRPKPRES